LESPNLAPADGKTLAVPEWDGITFKPPANVQVEMTGSTTISSFAGVGCVRNDWSPADLVYIGTTANKAQYQVKGSHVYAQANEKIPIVVYATGVDGTSISKGPTKVGRGHAAKVLFASNPKKQRSIAQEVVAGSVFPFEAGPNWAGRFKTGSSAMRDGSRKRRISDNLVRRRWYAEHRARRFRLRFELSN
jgi:hypothetical protein